jgi:hypothetical protein
MSDDSKQCPQCNKLFRRLGSRRSWERRKFCSNVCANEAKRGRKLTFGRRTSPSPDEVRAMQERLREEGQPLPPPITLYRTKFESIEVEKSDDRPIGTQPLKLTAPRNRRPNVAGLDSVAPDHWSRPAESVP